jgi:hypothetical protein
MINSQDIANALEDFGSEVIEVNELIESIREDKPVRAFLFDIKAGNISNDAVNQIKSLTEQFSELKSRIQAYKEN